MVQLLFQLAGGRLFPALAAVTLAVVAAGFLFRSRAGLRALQAILPFAVLGVLLSAPPLPRGTLFIWTLLALVSMGELTYRSRKGLTPSGRFSALLIAATLGLVALEAPYLRMPDLSRGTEPYIYVVGDSLSAGIGAERHTWPEILAEKTGRPVANLASPGARLADGPAQVREIADNEDALVFVLLGGNDILFRASPEDYERDLRELLDRLYATRHSVVLFELPVIVGFRHYGRIQRRLAREYDIPLVPAGIISRVLSADDGTLDGIHLTDRGHRDLAERIAALFDID